MALWDQAGVPHKGWRCIDVEDLGVEGRGYTPGTCEMCGNHPLRYIHMMEHENHDPLQVGCVCAEKMAIDYDATAAEKKLQRKAGVRSRWLSRRWSTSQKGNPYLRLNGLIIGVSRQYSRWTFWIIDPDQDTRQHSKRSYEKEDEAKLALFEAYWQVKQ